MNWRLLILPLLLLAGAIAGCLVPLSARAQSPAFNKECFLGLSKTGWRIDFPRWGYDGGILWGSWYSFQIDPTSQNPILPGRYCFIGGPLSWNTFGPRLQAIRTAEDPVAAAEAAWLQYVKVDAKKDPALKILFEKGKQ